MIHFWVKGAVSDADDVVGDFDNAIEIALVNGHGHTLTYL